MDIPPLGPTRAEEIKIMAVCLGGGCKYFFKHLVYQFAGKLYCQKTGLPIGYSSSRDSAKLRIANWSRKVKCMLRDYRINIILVLSYINDIQYFSQGIQLDYYWCYKKKELIYSRSLEETRKRRRIFHKPEDCRCTEICHEW